MSRELRKHRRLLGRTVARRRVLGFARRRSGDRTHRHRGRQAREVLRQPSVRGLGRRRGVGGVLLFLLPPERLRGRERAEFAVNAARQIPPLTHAVDDRAADPEFAQRRNGTPRDSSNVRAAARRPSRPNERRSSTVRGGAARRRASCRALMSTRSSCAWKRASTSGGSDAGREGCTSSSWRSGFSG